MDVILHIGAHRTGTTTFQRYMRANDAEFTRRGLEFWGPRKTRSGLFSAATHRPPGGAGRKAYARLIGRVRLVSEAAARRGVKTLVISDENLLGSCRRSIVEERLYADAGERLAFLAEAFEGRLSRVVMSMRGQETWWSSALAFGLPRGLGYPKPDKLDRLVTQPRGWRSVISDAACATGVPIHVAPFERFAGRPEALAAAMLETDGPMPMAAARCWVNRAPDRAALRRVLEARGRSRASIEGEGRWCPFDAAQTAALREIYADDLFWLSAGADGLATLVEDTRPAAAGAHPRGRPDERGQEDGDQERAMG